MKNNYQNVSNNGVERFASKNDGGAVGYKTFIDVDNDTTTVEVLSSLQPTTVAAPPIREPGRNPGLPNPRIFHPPPTAEPLSANQASSRGSAVTAQLQACLTTVAQLQSENQQIKTQICEIIHEITDESLTLGTESPSSDWYSILSSTAEVHVLRSCYDELWARQVQYSTQEITKDLYMEMVQIHGTLRKQYRQVVRSHAVLKDDLQRLTGQFANPLDPGAPPFFIFHEDDGIPVVGMRAVLAALRDGQQAPVQPTQEPQPMIGGRPLQPTPVVPTNRSVGNRNKRRLEQQPPITGGANGSPSTPAAPALPLSKRRRLGDV